MDGLLGKPEEKISVLSCIISILSSFCGTVNYFGSLNFAVAFVILISSEMKVVLTLGLILVSYL